MTEEHLNEPFDGWTAQQIDDECVRLRDHISSLLDRLSTLMDAKRSLTVSGPSGKELASAAFTSKEALDGLRFASRAMHPWIVDVCRWSVDFDGEVFAWAPVVVARNTSLPSDIEEAAEALRQWMKRFDVAVEQGRVRVPGYRLVDVRLKGPRRWGQLWVSTHGQGVLVTEGKTFSHPTRKGLLVEVLEFVSAQCS